MDHLRQTHPLAAGRFNQPHGASRGSYRHRTVASAMRLIFNTCVLQIDTCDYSGRGEPESHFVIAFQLVLALRCDPYLVAKMRAHPILKLAVVVKCRRWMLF